MYRNPSEINDDFGGKNAYLSIYFQLADEREVLIRRRTTVLSVIQKTGGFATSAFFLVSILAFSYSVKGLNDHLNKSF